jgi:hypothetical protein
MVKRLTVAVLALFWAVMMFHLWQSEYGGRPVGARVPVSLVWNRILTAPDTSTLEIRQGTNRLGYCRWRADVGQEYATGARSPDPDDELEAMVQNLVEYTLDVDGNVNLPEAHQRARFIVGLKLDTNRVWREFSVRVKLGPDAYVVAASAEQQIVNISVEAGADSYTRAIKFSDLQNPQKLLAELGGPALPLMLGMFGMPPQTTGTATNAARRFGLKWEAHHDWLLLGRNRVRVYRLKGSLLDRYHATLYVSPVGEILRMELPQQVLLVNDHLIALRPHD